MSLLVPQTYSELERWAQRAAKTDMVPKAFRGKPDDLIICVQYGSEIGFGLMESLRSIAVINGIPGVYGDGLLAICQRSPDFEDCIEVPEIDDKGAILAYVCEARRTGRKPKIHRFSVIDATKAKLWGKEGTWTQYPQRMLQMIARGFALRDKFADVLKGIISAEEASDYPTLDGAIDGAVVTKQQLSQIVDLLTETNTDSTAFLKLMFSDVAKLEDIPAGDFHRALSALNQKKQRMPPPPPPPEGAP